MVIMSCYTTNCSEVKCSFIDLLWDDILFSKILPMLSLKELYVLRGLSSKYKFLIDSYFKSIKKINLEPYKSIFSVEAFKVLSNNCTSLQEFTATSCYWLTNDLIVPLFKNNNHLTDIVLNQCDLLTSECLQPVMINCKNLRKLCLAGCGWFTVSCLQSITLYLNNLEEINFSSCYSINNEEALANFFLLSPKIRVVDISQLSCVKDKTLAILRDPARQLDSLSFTDSSQYNLWDLDFEGSFHWNHSVFPRCYQTGCFGYSSCIRY